MRTFLCATLLSCLTAVASAQPVVQTIYAHVADESGGPATRLNGSDFAVAVENAAQRIVRVTYAGYPKRILLLVDTSASLTPGVINPLRRGLQTFINAVPEDDEIALVTIGQQFHVRVEPTSDKQALIRGVANVFSEDGNTVLLDSLLEGHERFLLRSETRAPIIVVVTTEGPESSGTQEERFTGFVRDIAARGTVAYAVVIGNSATGQTTRPTASANRDIDNAIVTNDSSAESVIAMNITKYTGGRYEYLNAPTAISDTLKSFASDIKADEQRMVGWYQIAFEAQTPPRSLKVGLTRPDAKLVELSQGRPKKSIVLKPR
jgi:Mg-chelatase subunit ChlD